MARKKCWGFQLERKRSKCTPPIYTLQTIQPIGLSSLSGSIIKDDDNFKYLGGWMHSTEKDFLVRKALAWGARHKFRTIWDSELSRKFVFLWPQWKRNIEVNKDTGETAK